MPYDVFKTYENLMRKSQNPHRKRPHVLPPLPPVQPFVLRPMDPLQPPNLLLMENRLGSPAPKPSLPHDSDYDFNSNSGKPLIKVSNHEEHPKRELNTRESMKFELLSDPLFGDCSNLLCKVQKMNSIKASELEGKRHDRENSFFNSIPKNQVKSLRNDNNLDKKVRCLSIQPLEESESLKAKCGTHFKVVQIPNRYAPLKPIGQTMLDNDN